MGFERVAEMQEEIMWLCEAARVPAVWATQVLEDLVKDGLPSRGEMTDAAMSGRAKCVLLNKGPNIAIAVEVLRKDPRRQALELCVVAGARKRGSAVSECVPVTRVVGAL